MKNFLFTFILIMVSVIAFGQNDFTKFLERIDALPSTEKQTVCDSFYNASANICIPRTFNSSAYFIYKGKADYVSLLHDKHLWFTDEVPFTNIEGTDFFYCMQEFESDARIEYKIYADGQYLRDSNNPNIAHNGWEGGQTNSVLLMPDYITPGEMIEKSNINKGILQKISIYSNILNRSYNVSVYLPYGYDSNNYKYPTVYFQDGNDYLKYGYAKTVLDNIIAEEICAPIIAVFVTPTDRFNEYVFDDAVNYCKAFGEEIVPFIDENYRTIEDRSRRLAIGDSDGAGISAYITQQYNNLFENVALQSIVAGTGDYFLENEQNFQNIKIHYTWGKYEYFLWSANQEEYKDALVNYGHEIVWKAYPEGHNFGFWGAYIDEILQHFFPDMSYVDVSGGSGGGNTTGLQNSLQYKTLKVYPNPFKDRIVFDLCDFESKEVKFQVFSSNLKLLQEGKIEYKNINEGSINLSDQPAGVYFIRINSASNLYQSIIIKK